MFVKGRRADFGTLGDSTGISDVKQAMDTAKEVKSVAGGDGGGGCMDGMCACKGKEAAAKSAKQAEVQKANPVPVDANGKEIQENDPACGPECKAAYQRRREEMAAWQKNEDLKASLKLPSVVKEGFAFAAELGKGLKAVLPAEAGQMSLQQIYTKYPKQADAVYAQVIKKYPNLAGVPLGTLLAGAPDIASMKLDDAIERAATLGGVPAAAPSAIDSVLNKVPGGAYGAGLGLLGVGALLYFVFGGKKK